MDKPKSVEACLAGLPDTARRPSRSSARRSPRRRPNEEAVVYGMPGFKLHGKGFVGYSAFNDHYSFFPMSPQVVDAHREELGERVTGKGTISFGYGKRLPIGLVKKVAKTHLAEVDARRT